MQKDNQIINAARRALADQSIISIYSDSEDTGKFEVVIPIFITETVLISRRFSPIGHYDGLFSQLIEDIYRIESNGAYEKKIAVLSQNCREDFLAIDDTSKEKEISSENPHIVLLDHAFKNELMVELELFGSGLQDAMGIVSYVDENEVTMLQYSDTGKQDSTAVIKAGAISAVMCDHEEARALMQLIAKESMSYLL